MPGTVIVGVSAEGDARDVLALARTLAPHDHLVLVHAYPFDDALSRSIWRDYGDVMHDDSRRFVERLRAEHDLSDTEIEVVGDTSAARALQEVATARDADLIVIGSAHHGAIGRVMLGDVARSTLSDAPCAVAVAPRDYRGGPLTDIAVAFDDSPEAHEALRYAAALAQAHGARVHAVHAVEAALTTTSLLAHGFDPTEVARDVREKAQAAIDEALSGLAADADGEAVTGVAHEVLEELSRHSDLIVIGSRRFGPVRRVVCGSTSDHLVHHASCPVLVVPRGAPAGERGEHGRSVPT